MAEFLLPMKGSMRQRGQSFGDRRLPVRPDNLRTSSPVPPLIAFIGKDDDLPADWMPLKARKRSADDIIPLQKDLRRLNGIDQPGEAPARQNAAALAALPATRSNSVPWHAMPLSKDLERRVNAIIGERSTNESWLTSCRRKVWMSVGLSRRQWADLKIKLLAHYSATNERPRPLRIDRGSIGPLSLRSMPGLLAAAYEIARDFYSIFVILWRLVWYFLRTPVYLLLSTLLLLQILAVGYTASADAFLDTFCGYKLPIVRDKVCSHWDQGWLPVDSSNSSTANLTKPLDDFLQSEDRAFVYELPFFVDKFQSVVRGYRVTLPQSGYPAEEQQRLHDLFTLFIDNSKYMVEISQKFNIQLDRTVNYHIVNSNYVVQQLRKDGILAPIREGILARAMRLLNSWYLLYLPQGLRPLHTTDVSTEVRSSSLILDHVRVMKEHFRNLIELVIALRVATGSLGSISELVQTHKVKLSTSNENEAVRADGRALRWIGERVWGKSFERWQLERRTKWVDNMNPDILEFMTKFFLRAEVDFNYAYHACIAMEDLLVDEEGRLRIGGELDGSVIRIATSLDSGIKGLEAHMGSFHMEKREFHDRLWKKHGKEDA